ncbi:MAG: alpha/beta fold hydrolase [Gammaproteobacteria bacterium]|nr:alpha/beta fold hydrolase [Gammaproteobacteria bacterium]
MEFGTTHGEMGNLEWMFEPASSASAMVLCHPHPLYGGSMLDGVLEVASRAATALEISTIRFNFRGVGASAGTHDKGTGEVSDLAAIVKEFAPRFEQLILGGYSFGGRVVLAYASQSVQVNDLVLIAPPTQDALPDLTSRVDVIVGDNDSISSTGVLSEWTQANPNRTLYVIDDADHFLVANAPDISDVLQRILSS